MDDKKKANKNTKTRASSHRDRDRCSNQCDRQEKDRYGHRTYKRHHQDDHPYNCNPPRQDRRDRDSYRDDKPRCNDDSGYAKAAEPAKDRKGSHHAHHMEMSESSPRQRSRSCSTESSVREVKKIRGQSPSHDRSQSRSTSESEENYHLQSGDSPTNATQDPSGWGRKPAAEANIVPLAAPHSNDGWCRKNPPEETKSSPKKPSEDPDALLESHYANSVVLPHHDRHRNNPPSWYLELSREPHLVNTQNKAVGLGLFFKHRSYDNRRAQPSSRTRRQHPYNRSNPRRPKTSRRRG